MTIESERTVAIVGLGAVAEPHLIACKTLRNVRLVAVVEPRTERREAIAREYGVPGYATLTAMLKEVRPDIACVLTPAQTHRALTEQCAAARVHVLCEKPMAVTLEDALAMAQACQQGNVQFFYGSSYRFLPAVQEARRLVAANEIGAVRLVVETAIGGTGADNYRQMSAAHYPEGGPGGQSYGLVDHGVHMIDAFPWICGSRVTGVFGWGDRTGQAARPEFGMLAMENGALGFVLYDGSTWPAGIPGEGVFSAGRRWVANHGWIGETGLWDANPGCITVYGAHGALRIFHYANRLFVNKGGVCQERPLAASATPLHFAEQLRQFCRDLDRNETPATSAEDGIQALRWLLAIYKSESSGGWQLA